MGVLRLVGTAESPVYGRGERLLPTSSGIDCHHGSVTLMPNHVACPGGVESFLRKVSGVSAAISLLRSFPVTLIVAIYFYTCIIVEF